LKERGPAEDRRVLSKVEFLESVGDLGLMELEDGTKVHSIPFQFFDDCD
jgi:hypothetical protein